MGDWVDDYTNKYVPQWEKQHSQNQRTEQKQAEEKRDREYGKIRSRKAPTRKQRVSRQKASSTLSRTTSPSISPDGGVFVQTIIFICGVVGAIYGATIFGFTGAIVGFFLGMMLGYIALAALSLAIGIAMIMGCLWLVFQMFV